MRRIRKSGPVGGGSSSPPLQWESAVVAYVSPACFQVTGVNRAAVYLPGTLVFLPNVGRWAAVQFAVYTGGNTLVFLMDPVCVSGLSSVGYYPQNTQFVGITPSSSTATYTQGGFSTSWLYDGSITSYWSDGTNASAGTAVAYTFGAAKKIRGVKISQLSGRGVASANLQYYNGSSWVTWAALAFHEVAFASEILWAQQPSTGYTQWQIVSTAAPDSSTWAISELWMSE